MTAPGTVPLLICSPLEPELVGLIRAVDERVEVLYDPALLARPRYVSDHGGDFPTLTVEQDRKWRDMLARATICFDFDRREPNRARANLPNVEWIQASSAGVGQLLPRFDLDLSSVVITTAAGVHATPLSEFAVASLFYFAKEFPQLRRWQQRHQWTRYTSQNLAGQTILIVGLGAVGRATAAALSALGVNVIAAVRPGGTMTGADVRATVNFDEVDAVLPQVDAVVLACPLTPQTEGLISESRIQAMKSGAVIVNVARGQLIDEEAMVRALSSGALGGAALDVVTVEPLPADSPLWDLPNVLISPHSASTVAAENQLLVNLFCENLRRWLAEEPLLNKYDPSRGY